MHALLVPMWGKTSVYMRPNKCPSVRWALPTCMVGSSERFSGNGAATGSQDTTDTERAAWQQVFFRRPILRHASETPIHHGRGGGLIWGQLVWGKLVWVAASVGGS